MSALFDFQSLVVVLLLFICTCTYFRYFLPSFIDRYKTGFSGVFWKAARIGERKSGYIAAFCFFMAGLTLMS